MEGWVREDFLAVDRLSGGPYRKKIGGKCIKAWAVQPGENDYTPRLQLVSISSQSHSVQTLPGGTTTARFQQTYVLSAKRSAR